jgi:hypothetical protein
MYREAAVTEISYQNKGGMTCIIAFYLQLIFEALVRGFEITAVGIVVEVLTEASP